MYRDEWGDLPNDRLTAILAGSLYYYNGVPCEDGHIVRRYASNNMCEVCISQWSFVRGRVGMADVIWNAMMKRVCICRKRFGVKANGHMQYTPQAARDHFERLFEPGMEWVNYGIIWRIKSKVLIKNCKTYEQAVSLDNHIPVFMTHDQKICARRRLSSRHHLHLARR